MLNELSEIKGHPATLYDVSDDYLNVLATHGFNIVYMLGTLAESQICVFVTCTFQDYHEPRLANVLAWQPFA
jgi:hypothetical protein